jgi:hypothetical protein
VVALLGLPGTGKTLLAARVARDLAPYFEHIYWRNLRNGLPFGEWLAAAIGLLSPRDETLLESQATQVDRLLGLLRESPTLLILDGFEAVLQPGDRTGGYLPGSSTYGELLRCLAESSHRSCLLLTGSEEPAQLSALSRAAGPARALSLGGMQIEDARALLEATGLFGDSAAWEVLISRYGGNGLALKTIGASICELFAGDVRAYIADLETAPGALFGGVRRLLDGQMHRLSPLEREVMRWLAIQTEPVAFVQLAAELDPASGRGAVREAVEALRRRSLLERREPGPAFSLQPLVLEYVTELIDEVSRPERSAGRCLP